MWQEFKKFAFKGNIVDLSVAVIIGGAFGKIVTSLVNDIIMPFIGVLLGGISFTKLSFTFGKSVIKYGTFIQTVVDFFIIALTLFLIIRVFLHLKRKEAAASNKPAAPSKEQLLLTDIRDLLKSSIEGSTNQPKITFNKQDD